MDSLTHIALGACIGEAFFEKGFGKKAMLWGALAQSIPDIDFVAALWMNTPESLLAHRGFTHSFLFALIIIPVFALIANQIHKPHNIQFTKWMLFFTVAIFIHLFIDAFNNYGIGWFEPFSHERYSFNVIYVADPFFTTPLIVSFTALLLLNRHNRNRKKWVKSGMVLSFIYLSYCTVNKYLVDQRFTDELKIQHIHFEKYFTTPAPLQNWLWYGVASADSGYYVAYFSLMNKNKTILFNYFKSNHQLAGEIADHESLQKLIRFSKQFYTINVENGIYYFNDLRFGQILGWRYPYNKFVFNYYLKHHANNDLVIQKGRFKSWSRDEFIFFIKKVLGY